MNRLPTSQRYKTYKQHWKHYEKEPPGRHIQIDVKFLVPFKGKDGKLRKHYKFTTIDDCTRLRVRQIYPCRDSKIAIAFVDHVAKRLPVPIDTIQLDNGIEVQTLCSLHVFNTGLGHTPTSNTPHHASTGESNSATASTKNNSIYSGKVS